VIVKRVVLLSLALLVVGAGAVVALGSRQGEREVVEGGPLDPGRESGSSASLPVPVGGAASFGLLFPENRGDAPATFETVELAKASDGLEIVGAYVQPLRAPGVGMLNGFPPRGAAARRQQLDGAEIAPGETLRLVVGLRARTAGWHTGKGFRVRYHVGDTTYVASFGYGVRLCAPYRKWFGRCPAP